MSRLMTLPSLRIRMSVISSRRHKINLQKAFHVIGVRLNLDCNLVIDKQLNEKLVSAGA